jgi:ABC-type sulfate transport system permease component
MAADSLVPFALQHAVTGMILYTLYAIPQHIDDANANLANRATDYRYIRLDGPSKPLPAPRS